MIETNNMLGNDGLTITSATHIANIAKEMYEAAQNRLESLKLYSRDYILAINGNTFRVENESDKSELNDVPAALAEIGELKSLIAYLREAIKVKEQLAKSFDKYLERLVEEGRNDLNWSVTEYISKYKESYSFDDEFKKLTPEQKARYYALEARCATIGAFIHPDGTFANARKSYFERVKNPTMVEGHGQETEINTYSTTFSAKEVDDTFFSLQKEYRNIQAEFNKLKADIDRKVSDEKLKIAQQAKKEREEYIAAKNIEELKYDAFVKSLKVVIPENLKGVYERVNKVASAK